ncbi:MAG: hypothetical protein R3C16_03750 [Hyphomonadaceae bacterium]
MAFRQHLRLAGADLARGFGHGEVQARSRAKPIIDTSGHAENEQEKQTATIAELDHRRAISAREMLRRCALQA